LVLKRPFIKLFKYEISRFLIVGSTTVLIDLIFYFIFIYLGFDIALSKGVSFSIGTIFAYFANRSYTFQSSRDGMLRFIYFVILYISTLVVNVMSNEIILNFSSHLSQSLLIAFLSATIISATLNFLGMNYLVFSSK
jgi:putative flippase GtrA